MRLHDQNGLTGFGFALAVAAVCIALVLAVVGCGTAASYVVDKQRCAAFARETARATKFKRTGPVDWTCFARTSDGKWLPRDQLRDVAP